MPSLLSQRVIECPPGLLQQAQAQPKIRTAVVNAGSAVVLESVRMAMRESLIEPVLVGCSKQITELAKQLEFDISELQIIHADSASDAAKLAVKLAHNDEVGALMKGALHTDELLKAVIDQANGLLIGRRLSHVFHMSIADSDASICITDAVINIAPDVAISLDIARNASSLLHALGNPQPRIAVLSASEVATPAMPSSMQAAQIVKAAQQGEVSDALLDGPFAFDIAVSPAAAELKGAGGPVAGQADVLLVPNIETGNALFKQMVYYMGAAAAGVVLGAKVPIALTSRADPAAARLAACALTSIAAGVVNTTR